MSVEIYLAIVCTLFVVAMVGAALVGVVAFMPLVDRIIVFIDWLQRGMHDPTK